MQSRRTEPEVREVAEGQKVAALFKYYIILRSRKYDSKISLNRISAKLLYDGHRKAFDGVVDFFNRIKMDIQPYIKFIIYEDNFKEEDIDGWLLSRKYITDYAASIQTRERREKTYAYFMKTADNIVRMCLAKGYSSSKECILRIIKHGKLAAFVMTGIISIHYLAAIPSFRKLIPKLDHFSRLELTDLYDKFDIYNTEINDTFMYMFSKKANPFEFTDELLFQKKYGKKDDVFDPSIE